MLAYRRLQPATNAVADDRGSHVSSHCERDARRFMRGRDDGPAHFECSTSAAPTSGQRPKRCAITDAPDQAERFARPLPRRRRITARPARVRMRSRKPCFFLRFRLFGWKVLFTHGLLGRPCHTRGPK